MVLGMKGTSVFRVTTVWEALCLGLGEVCVCVCVCVALGLCMCVCVLHWD